MACAAMAVRAPGEFAFGGEREADAEEDDCEGDLLECSACLEEFEEPFLIPSCGHTFCLECVQGSRGNRCFICRKEFDIMRNVPNSGLQVWFERDAEYNSEKVALVAGGHRRLGAPPVLSHLLAEEDASIARRVYLLDNSSAMIAADASVIEQLSRGSFHVSKATRWEQLRGLVAQQVQRNIMLGVPCEFVLLNSASPDAPQEGQDFFHIDPVAADAAGQARNFAEVLARHTPRGPAPSAERLDSIRHRLHGCAAELARKRQRLALVIVTGSVPAEPQEIFVQALWRFSCELPAELNISLCTNQAEVLGFFNAVGKELEVPMAIVQDLATEARKVHAQNPWLVHSPVLQTIRESGSLVRTFDFVGERALTPMEVALCAHLLVHSGVGPAYDRRPEVFLRSLEQDLPRAPLVFDVAKGAMVPPIDLEALQRAVCPGRCAGAQAFLRDVGLGGIANWWKPQPSPSVEEPDVDAPDPYVQDVPLSAGESGAAPLCPGFPLDYYSHSQNIWFPCVVTQVGSKGIVVNLKPGVWFSVAQQRSLFRPQRRVVGMRLEYYSANKQAWFACTVTHVDDASGEVTIDLKRDTPLFADQARTCLRLPHSAASQTTCPPSPVPGAAPASLGGASAGPFLVGAQLDYFSVSSQAWFPCIVTHVDAAAGAVTIDLKPAAPLTSEQAQKNLRPRSSHSERVASTREVTRILRLPGGIDEVARPKRAVVSPSVGVRLEYYSTSKGAWFACLVTSVDSEAGTAEIDLKPGAPLTAEQMKTCLRFPQRGSAVESGRV